MNDRFCRTRKADQNTEWFAKAALLDTVKRMSASDNVADIQAVPHDSRMSDLGTIKRLKIWAGNLRRDVIALWLAAQDTRVPLYAKMLSSAVAAYALSPIDLIPDFLPIFGYLDDLLILPVGIWAAVKLIPKPIMADLRTKALDHRKPVSKTGLVAVLFIWLAATG